MSIVVNFFNTKNAKNSQRAQRFKRNKILFGDWFCSLLFETASFFKSFITDYGSKGFPSNVADFNIFSATLTAAGESGA